MSTELKRILCIDDEEDILEVAKMSLEAVGSFDVHICHDSTKAVDMACDFKPDMILLDVMMPNMDGPTTLQALRERPELDHVPVVFMTARVQQAEIQEYKDIGAIGIVAKPFDPMELSSQVLDIWQTEQQK